MKSLFSGTLAGICLLLAVACGGSDTPDGVLKKDKMMQVMEDLGKAEELASNYTARDTTQKLKTEQLRFYGKVFLHHGITRNQFNRSMEYYISKPYLAKDMFDSLSARLRRTSYTDLSKPQ
jgi:hypothetical protein